MTMDKSRVPNDDLLDVMEMTKALEEKIAQVLEDMDADLAVSALISATINCLCAQCDTLSEIVFFRDVFMQVMDGHIRTIKIKPS